jgi:hypothetical protein
VKSNDSNDLNNSNESSRSEENIEATYEARSLFGTIKHRSKYVRYFICHPHKIKRGWKRRKIRNAMSSGRIILTELSKILPSHPLVIKKCIPKIQQRIKSFEEEIIHDTSGDSIVHSDEIVESTSQVIVIQDGEIYYCVDGNCRLICLKIAAQRLDEDPIVEVSAFDLNNDELMQELRKQVEHTISTDLCPIL